MKNDHYGMQTEISACTPTFTLPWATSELFRAEVAFSGVNKIHEKQNSMLDTTKPHFLRKDPQAHPEHITQASLLSILHCNAASARSSARRLASS